MSLRKSWLISLMIPMSALAVPFGESSHFGLPARFSDPMGAPRHVPDRIARGLSQRSSLTLPAPSGDWCKPPPGPRVSILP